jgi:replicative DNA helicase
MPRLDSIRDGTFEPAWTPALTAVKDVLGFAEPSDYIVIAARPGEGKSSYLRYEAYKHLQRGGRGVLMMENENDPFEYARLFLSLETGLDNMKLKSGHLSAGEMELVRTAALKLRSMPLYIEFATSASDISRLSRKYKVTKNIDLQMFDYIQLASNGQAKKNDDVSITSRALRLAALEMGVPMISASQLNREIEHRADAEPQLSDLRDSGSVEQDACAVVFPRLTWNNPTPEMMARFPENIDPRSTSRTPVLLPRPKAVPVKFWVRKNRNGEIGDTTVVKWVKSTGLYYTLASNSGF